MKVEMLTLACVLMSNCFGQNGDPGLRPGAPDTSPHKVQFLAVDANVRLEVLDWGGPGRSLVLLAGLGVTAHVFDELAPKLAPNYHVFGITRRGSGASSAPKNGYAADQLGDDVIAVLDLLKLERPVLIGFSFGGEELSSVGTRHPDRVAGLIYLDAGYSYAYYNASRGDFYDDPRSFVDFAELRRKLSRLLEGGEWNNPQLLQELLKTNLPEFEKDLQERQKEIDLESRLRGPATQALPPAPPRPPASDQLRRSLATMSGMQKYTEIRVPVLAIYAIPPDLGNQGAAAEAREAFREEQAKAFENGVPQAHVVRLPHALHEIWRSNEADVLREIHAFIGSLP